MNRYALPTPVQRCLATFETGRDGVARALTLRTAACSLATLAADAAPDALLRPARPGSRLQIVDLHLISSTCTR